MSKSGRPHRDEKVEEEVLERLPRWRRELLRMLGRARTRARDENSKRDNPP